MSVDWMELLGSLASFHLDGRFYSPGGEQENQLTIWIHRLSELPLAVNNIDVIIIIIALRELHSYTL